MADIITTITGLQGLATLKGSSKDIIALTEKRLELIFAADYAVYLEKFALISAKHIELTGIVDSKRLNVADVTLSARINNKIPLDMYVIEDTGIEGILILQNGKGEIFEFQNITHIKKIAESLTEYLISK
jgi:hypothetical protein